MIELGAILGDLLIGIPQLGILNIGTQNQVYLILKYKNIMKMNLNLMVFIQEIVYLK